MTGWSNAADEQDLLRDHIRNLVADLDADDRVDALLDIIIGLTTLGSGLLKLHTAKTGPRVADILGGLRQRRRED